MRSNIVFQVAGKDGLEILNVLTLAVNMVEIFGIINVFRVLHPQLRPQLQPQLQHQLQLQLQHRLQLL